MSQKPARGPLSAGILLYRQPSDALIEVLIAHPGGPFWANRDRGAWSIPKGLVKPGEEPLDAARREFGEETGLRIDPRPAFPLGSVRQASGKTVIAWALEGDADVDTLESNHFEIEWPRRSGRRVQFPEMDRFLWADADVARAKLNRAQRAFVWRLHKELYGE